MTRELREDEVAGADGLPPDTVDALDLRGAEQDLAGGRSTFVPFSLLGGVAVVIAAVVAVGVALVALAYAVA